METTTFYSSSDGWCRQEYGAGAGVNWPVIRAAAGNVSYDSTNYMLLNNIICDGTVNQWRGLSRSIFLFDTSSLPDDCIIVSAVLSLFGYVKFPGSALADVCVYSSNPAFDTSLLPADFTTLGVVPLSEVVSMADLVEGAYNDFPLNAAGIALISRIGKTKLGSRDATHDVGGVVPTWTANDTSYLAAYTLESAAVYRPKLVVTYLPSSGTLKIPAYTSQDSSDTRDVRLSLKIDRIQRSITRPLFLYSLPKRVQQIDLRRYSYTITVTGKLFGMHEAHPVTDGIKHLACFIDLEEAVVLFPRSIDVGTQSNLAELRLNEGHSAGARTYQGDILSLDLTRSEGEQSADFTLIFGVVSRPTDREWHQA